MKNEGIGKYPSPLDESSPWYQIDKVMRHTEMYNVHHPYPTNADAVVAEMLLQGELSQRLLEYPTRKRKEKRNKTLVSPTPSYAIGHERNFEKGSLKVAMCRLYPDRLLR